jgi:hypothetical protein
MGQSFEIVYGPRAVDDEQQVDTIEAWFREHGRHLRLQEQDDGTWVAIFALTQFGSWAPSVAGATKLEAARNAVAAFLELPENTGKDITPPD